MFDRAVIGVVLIRSHLLSIDFRVECDHLSEVARKIYKHIVIASLSGLL